MNKKLGIIIDSSIGITEKEANTKGWFYLPLSLEINKVEYKDGKTLTPDQYYKKIDINDEVRTGTTSPGIVEEVIRQAKEKFDKVLIYTLSTELSSQNSMVRNVAMEFENVHVIDSKGVSKICVKTLEEAEELYTPKTDWTEFTKKIDDVARSFEALLMPRTLKWLVKGGRVSGATAALGSLLNIVPMIKLKDGKLDKYGKGRNFNKTVVKAAKHIFDVKNRDDYNFVMISARNEQENEVKHRVNEVLGIESNIMELVVMPPVITNHTGTGSIAIGRVKKLK